MKGFSGIPGHALRKNEQQKQKYAGPLASSQERKAAVVPRFNRSSTGYQPLVNRSSTGYRVPWFG